MFRYALVSVLSLSLLLSSCNRQREALDEAPDVGLRLSFDP